MGGGAILSGLVLAAVGVFVIEKKFVEASAFALSRRSPDLLRVHAWRIRWYRGDAGGGGRLFDRCGFPVRAQPCSGKFAGQDGAARGNTGRRAGGIIRQQANRLSRNRERRFLIAAPIASPAGGAKASIPPPFCWPCPPESRARSYLALPACRCARSRAGGARRGWRRSRRAARRWRRLRRRL